MIHKTAIVDKKAKISAKAIIGPFSIVGPNVEMGEGAEIQSHVSCILYIDILQDLDQKIIESSKLRLLIS